MTSRGPTALTPITRCMPLSMSQGLGWGMAMATQSLLVVQGWEEMSSEVTSAHPGRELREGKKKRADVQEGIVCLEKGLQKQSSLTAWPLQEWSNVRGIVPMALRHWQAKGHWPPVNFLQSLTSLTNIMPFIFPSDFQDEIPVQPSWPSVTLSWLRAQRDCLILCC